MRNPNTLRRIGLMPAVFALAAGAACTAQEVAPNPNPNAPSVVEIPACTGITAEADPSAPHTMSIRLKTTDNIEAAAMWSPDHATYDFGDGTSADANLNTVHSYPQAGSFVVKAEIFLDIAVDNPPFKGSMVSCLPTEITVP